MNHPKKQNLVLPKEPVHIVIVDFRPDRRAALVGRTSEVLRQTDLKRFTPIGLDLFNLERFEWSLAIGVIIGSGCQENLTQAVQTVREFFPSGDIAAVLGREKYLARR